MEIHTGCFVIDHVYRSVGGQLYLQLTDGRRLRMGEAVYRAADPRPGDQIIHDGVFMVVVKPGAPEG